jgi:hypothetical protein
VKASFSWSCKSCSEEGPRLSLSTGIIEVFEVEHTRLMVGEPMCIGVGMALFSISPRGVSPLLYAFPVRVWEGM